MPLKNRWRNNVDELPRGVLSCLPDVRRATSGSSFCLSTSSWSWSTPYPSQSRWVLPKSLKIIIFHITIQSLDSLEAVGRIGELPTVSSLNSEQSSINCYFQIKIKSFSNIKWYWTKFWQDEYMGRIIGMSLGTKTRPTDRPTALRPPLGHEN